MHTSNANHIVYTCSKHQPHIHSLFSIAYVGCSNRQYRLIVVGKLWLKCDIARIRRLWLVNDSENDGAKKKFPDTRATLAILSCK